MAEVRWNGRAYFKMIADGMEANMQRATAKLEREVKRRLRIGQPVASLTGGWKVGLRPAPAGKAPRSFMGRLRQTIFRRVFFTRSGFEKDALIGQVGSPLPYARSLEKGRTGGKIIRPKRARVLIVPLRGSFEPLAARALRAKVNRKRIRQKAKFVFAKQVRQGAMKPRPFLMPTLREQAAALSKLLTRNIRFPVPKGPP